MPNKQSSVLLRNQENDSVMDFIHDKWMFVHELKGILEDLDDDDWLVPNRVGNLLVKRRNPQGENDSIAFVDFTFTGLEWLTNEVP